MPSEVRRAEAVFAALFFGLGIWVVIQAIGLRYYFGTGPGPGFFPLWLGLVLALTSGWLLVRVLRTPPTTGTERFLPTQRQLARSLGTLGALAAFAIVAPTLGFRVAMFLLFLVLVGVIGRRGPVSTLLTALIGSFGSYFLFHDLLGLYLPRATMWPLSTWGL